MENEQKPFEESKHYDVFKSSFQSDFSQKEIESSQKREMGKETNKMPLSQNFIG